MDKPLLEVEDLSVTFKGAPFEYSKANAFELLVALPRLLAALTRYAEDIATFQAASDEADEKN